MDNYETKPNQLAFPCNRDLQYWGLTKRELFAAITMAGLQANSHENVVSMSKTSIARAAIKAADALIEELNDNP